MININWSIKSTRNKWWDGARYGILSKETHRSTFFYFFKNFECTTLTILVLVLAFGCGSTIYGLHQTWRPTQAQ